MTDRVSNDTPQPRKPRQTGAAPERARLRRRSQEPTVSDVAMAAGVSLMTVSRVVNAAGNVAAKTRIKVEAAIAALGYVPNPVARSLAGGRQCRIALLYANPSAAYLSEFLVGMLRATSAQTALFLEEHRPGANPLQIIDRIRSHRADGVVLPPPLCDDGRLVRALTDAGLTVAQVATGAPDAQCSAVMIDDAQAARTMTAYLLSMGHRRIGFITGADDQTASTQRQAGFAAALRDAGITPDPAHIAQGDFTYRSGLDAAGALLDAGVTAIFASNDDMAAAAVAVAHRRNLDVPGDIAIAGFDDTAMATTIWPALTTIRQPIADMAEYAMRQLVAQLAGDAMPAHQSMPFTLVRRGSTEADPAL